MINIELLIKNATISKDRVALNAYKNIKAEFQKVKTSKNYKGDWNDNLEIQIISKYSKSLEDAICQFSQAHRDDLVAEYRNELEVIKKLLPAPVNESEICSFIEDDENFFGQFWVTLDNIDDPDWQNGGEGTHMELHIPKKEMGNAIKYLKSKFPTADGKMISEIVKKYLV